MPVRKTTKTNTKSRTSKADSVLDSDPTRLYRSTKDKVLGGVAGGLADFFNVDSTIVRLIFVLLSIFGGSGILIYLVLWLIIPSETSVSDISGDNIKENAAEIKMQAEKYAEEIRGMSDKGNPRSTVGLVILVLGVLLLLSNFGLFRLFDMGRLWPLVLVAIGFAILFRNDKR